MWSLLIFTFRKSTNSVLTLKNLVILPFSVEQCVGVAHPRKAACYNKPCLKLTACSISILLSSICSSIPSFTPSYGCIHSIISIVTDKKWLQLVKSHSNGKLGGNGDNNTLTAQQIHNLPHFWYQTLFLLNVPTFLLRLYDVK